jgi:hypothetical protein
MTLTYDNYPPPSPEPEPPEDLKAALKAWHRAVSHHAILAAQKALRSAPDDPSPRIPLAARRAPHVRQRSKRRVCGGSSRYRVRVN